jgi:hypothetical protein
MLTIVSTGASWTSLLLVITPCEEPSLQAESSRASFLTHSVTSIACSGHEA